METPQDLPPKLIHRRLWEAFTALLLIGCPPIGIVVAWKKRLWTPQFRIGATLVSSVWMAGPFIVAKLDPYSDSKYVASSSDTSQIVGAVLKDTVLYADRETLALVKREAGKSDEAGTRALERLGASGKIWTAEFDTKVRVVETGGPWGSVFIEAENDGLGHKARRAWAQKSSVLAMQHPAVRRALDKSRTVSKSKFRYMLDGTDSVEIGDTPTSDLIELVAGIYEGTIPESTAMKCLVLPDAIGGSHPCGFERVVGERLIYEGGLSSRERYQFALVRDHSFEEGYPTPAEFYADIKESDYHSDNPIRNGSLIFVGRENFTTRVGFVLSIPVFKVVNVQP